MRLTNSEVDSLKLRMDYVERGIEKTEVALEKRLDGMNEFRAQLKDQTQTYISRVEFEAKILVMETKIESLQKFAYIGIGVALVAEFAFKFVLK